MRKVVYARTQTHMTTCALTQSDWYGADLSVQQSLSCIRIRLISWGRSQWSNQTSSAFSGCFVLLWHSDCSDCSCSSYAATSGDTFQKATMWRINLNQTMFLLPENHTSLSYVWKWQQLRSSSGSEQLVVWMIWCLCVTTRSLEVCRSARAEKQKVIRLTTDSWGAAVLNVTN